MKKTFCSFWISGLTSHLLCLENLLHDKALQCGAVKYYLFGFFFSEYCSPENAGFDIFQPLALASWRVWSWWSLLQPSSRVWRAECCASLCPPAPHTLFHISLPQLCTNSSAVSYVFQLTIAGYKPGVIFHGQTFWSCSWCLAWWWEEQNMLRNFLAGSYLLLLMEPSWLLW